MKTKSYERKKVAHPHVNHNGRHAPERQNSRRRSLDTKTLVLGGAAALAVIGVGAAALLYASRKRDLPEQFSDITSNIKDQAGDYLQGALEKGREAYDTVSDYAQGIKDKAYELYENAPRSRSNALLIGAIAGTILGGATFLLLAPKAGKDLRRDLARAYSRVNRGTMNFADQIKEIGKSTAKNVQSIDWMDLAENVIDSIQSKFEEVENSHSRNGYRRQEPGALQNLAEWAGVGLSLWKNFKKRS